MAYDKVIDSAKLDADLTTVADAIRIKTGKTDKLTLEQMPTEIESIQTGGGGVNQLDEFMDGTITDINSKVTNVIAYALRESKALITVNLPNCTTIGTYAFYNCNGLKVFNAPNLSSIGSNAFTNCKSLLEINFPSADSIKVYCFSNNTSLVKVDLGVTKSIAGYAFEYDAKLVTLILRKSDEICTLSNSNAFRSSAIANGSGYIYVPSALVDAYKSATNWSNYASQIRAIEDYPDICGD